ncbi:MAG: LamG domain-containing protein, partial [Myxococcota bacterium]|nr:LamG domain-containing protein [Myxococcota bacterium]
MSSTPAAWCVRVWLLAFLSCTGAAHAFPAGDPVAYYPFDDCGGGISPEMMGTGLDATLVNTACGADNSLGLQLGGSWHSGTALYCDGYEDYAYAPDDTLFEPSQFTLSLWVYSDDFGTCGSSHCSLVSKGNTDGSPAGYWLITDDSGTLRLSIADGSNETSFFGAALSTGTWHHVTATFDGSTAVLYLDGADVGSASLAHGIGYSSDPFVVGAIPNRRYDHYGYLEEVALFDWAMAATDVGELFDWYADADADGFNHADDCDPDDPAINPGAAEDCDGVDDDCDGDVDEGFDADGDGLADCFDTE